MRKENTMALGKWVGVVWCSVEFIGSVDITADSVKLLLNCGHPVSSQFLVIAIIIKNTYIHRP